MKRRIKIDSSILSFIIILTGFLYLFPGLYPKSQIFDNVLDFFGLMMILEGTYIRMTARGHKKAHSQEGEGLVKTGLYAYTRNPMYLGSFWMGGGFVLIVWPWWTLPLLGGLFYLRFKRQVVKEEGHLTKIFGESYETYCQEVPRVFPSFKSLADMNMKEVLCREEAWSTKEKRGLIAWPILAIVLETMQEKIVFNIMDIRQTVFIFFLAGMGFVLGVWYASHSK